MMWLISVCFHCKLPLIILTPCSVACKIYEKLCLCVFCKKWAIIMKRPDLMIWQPATLHCQLAAVLTVVVESEWCWMNGWFFTGYNSHQPSDMKHLDHAKGQGNEEVVYCPILWLKDILIETQWYLKIGFCGLISSRNTGREIIGQIR